jgi:hypothetical protein
MTTTTLDAAAAGSERSWTRLLAPIGGLGIVGGLIALLLSPAGDDAGETPAEVVAYAASHDGWSAAGSIFGLLVLLLGGLFVAGLHARLRASLTPTESTLVLAGGIVFMLGLAFALLLWTTPLLDIPDETARGLVAAEAYLTVDDFGWFLFGAAGVGAALMAVPASLAALRSASVPAWLGWLGVALGVASLATVAFFGMIAWLLWIAGASLLLAAKG